MSVSSPIEVESLPPTSMTSSSSLTLTTRSGPSPLSHGQRQTFFQTIKREPKNQIKKRRKIFETTNKIENQPPTFVPLPTAQEPPPVPPQLKFKENYLHLLIAAASYQIENGLITMEYLNTPSYPKFSDFSYSSLDEDPEIFSKKCENKMCAVVVDNPDNIYHTKFLASQSFKVHSLWLCKRCHAAWKLGNYCYYCNMIYRDFDFNQQYYDRKKWIQCDYCQKWQHMQCEEKKGKFQNIEELALNQNFKYMCPLCRKESSHLYKEHLLFEKSNY